MAEDDNQEQKTEDPTDKRLQDARDKGQLAVSREVPSWTLFMAALLVVAWLGPDMAGTILTDLRVFLEKPEQIDLDDGGLQTILAAAVMHIAVASLMVFALLGSAVIIGTLVQTGFYANSTKLVPDMTRLNPIRGFKQIFSLTSVVELLKSFVKMVVIGGAVLIAVMPLANEIISHAGHNLITTMAFVHEQSVHIIVIMSLIVTVIAVADLLYQRWSFLKQMRMTPQEIKDENKQMEGDPIIKARIRQIRMARARQRMMAQVPTADVIITNPTHYAIALRYDGAKMAAPVVVAKGMNRIAERIRTVASENNVPLVSNPTLARALYDTVEVDQPIKPEQYRAVAEIISYVYKLKHRRV